MKSSMKQPLDPQPLGPKKTFIVMVTVVGCIAVLWPKIFHPMLFSTTPKPNVVKDHRGSGCCDVVLDQDEFANMSVPMQISTERPTFRKHLKLFTEEISVRQERPPHLRADGIHPAMKERGRAIHPSLPTVPITSERPYMPPIKAKIIDGRPGPIPGMRPPMGAGSHPQSTKTSSMGFIMPLYTIGIVAFFIYTIMKLVCKKSPTTPYEPVQPDTKFREKVFENTEQHSPLIKRPDDGTTKLAWKDHDASYIYHPDYIPDNLYENSQHIHHCPSFVDDKVSFKELCKNDAIINENNVKEGSQIKPHKNIEDIKNNIKNNEFSNIYSKNDHHDGLSKESDVKKILEHEYKLKEKQQLLEIDTLRKRLAETERAMANIISKMELIPTNVQKDINISPTSDIELIENGILQYENNDHEDTEKHKRDASKDRGQVQVLGFELSATCEDQKKWNRPSSPLLSPLLSRKHHHEHSNTEEIVMEAKPIYIQAPVEADSQILVTDTNQTAEELLDDTDLEEDPTVVLSGRMTLSLISPRITTHEKKILKPESTEVLNVLVEEMKH